MIGDTKGSQRNLREAEPVQESFADRLGGKSAATLFPHGGDNMARN
jgi:hypothetical protein